MILSRPEIILFLHKQRTGSGGQSSPSILESCGGKKKKKMVRKWSASSLRGQPDLVIQFFIAEEPSLSVCQIGSAASCCRLRVFRAPIVALHEREHSRVTTKMVVIHSAERANGSNWHQTLKNWSPYSGWRPTPINNFLMGL